jgi:hypothetical protein
MYQEVGIIAHLEATGVVTGPTIIGFITGVWGRYNHKFRIK